MNNDVARRVCLTGMGVTFLGLATLTGGLLNTKLKLVSQTAQRALASAGVGATILGLTITIRAIVLVEDPQVAARNEGEDFTVARRGNTWYIYSDTLENGETKRGIWTFAEKDLTDQTGKPSSWPDNKFHAYSYLLRYRKRAN